MDGDRARAAAAGRDAVPGTAGAPAPRPGTGTCRAASDRTHCLRHARSGTARARDQAAASLDARVEHPPAARIGGCRLIPKLYVAPLGRGCDVHVLLAARTPAGFSPLLAAQSPLKRVNPVASPLKWASYR